MDNSKIRVLVVDDEPSVRDSLRDYLEDFDFQVTAVESGEDALEILKTSPYDVGIIDLRLKGISGDTLIFRIAEMGKGKNMSFIIHTGSTNFHLTQEMLEMGIKPENLLLKPLEDMTILLQAIENALTCKPVSPLLQADVRPS